MKKISVKFSLGAESIYQKLKESNLKSDKSILNSINNKVELLKLNPHIGNPISKKLIPKIYNSTNLFRIELPCFWRMLYVLDGNSVEIIAFVLDIISHDDYNKIFGYKKH